MKKNSDLNTLINKQLKLIYKKESKLIKEDTNNYFTNKLSPIKNSIEDKIPPKLQTTLELAFEKAFKTVFEKGVGIIEKTYDKDSINMEFDINSYSINKYPNKKNIKNLDKIINKKALVNKSFSVIEGSGLGFLGIGLPDIPIYISVILKSIYEICLTYGFDYKYDDEKAYILTLISSSVTKGEKRKYYFDKLDSISQDIDNNIVIDYDLNKLLSETSSNISTYMLTAKFIQGLPIVGVVGGVTNLLTLQDITTISKLQYKKRYLKKLL